jgi:hypothetical protein
VLVLNAADDRVLVVDVRRDQRRVLRLDPGAQLDGASFSPDAAEIVLAESEADGDGNSLVLATRTGTRRLGAFGHTVGLPVWGPQGLADVQRGASVQLRPSIAAPPRTIFLGGDGENLAPLAWSGDGRVLLVRSVTLDLASEPNLPQAILISPSTGRSTAIRGYTEIYDVSADGASVLAQLGRDVVSARTGGVDATVAVSAQSASWSRRG